MTSQAAFGPPFFLPALLAALLLGGCATERAYEGPPVPRADRAVVRADPVLSAGLPVEVRIRRADGRAIGFATSRVELLPGRHHFVIDCRVSASGAVRRFTLEEDLEAGGRYRVVAQATARNCEAVALVGD